MAAACFADWSFALFFFLCFSHCCCYLCLLHSYTTRPKRTVMCLRCIQNCMCNLTAPARLLSRLTHVMPAKWDDSVYFLLFLLPAVSRISASDSRSPIHGFIVLPILFTIKIWGIREAREFFALCERQLESIICFKLRLLVDCYWL